MTEEFLSFNDIDPQLSNRQPTKEIDENDIEDKISAKYNLSSQYPWVSEQTLRIKNIWLFLHNEILDFLKFISPTAEDKQVREKVVKRLKEIINK